MLAEAVDAGLGENGTSWIDGRSQRGPRIRGIWQRGGRQLCTQGGERGGCEMPFLIDTRAGDEGGSGRRIGQGSWSNYLIYDQII